MLRFLGRRTQYLSLLGATLHSKRIVNRYSTSPAVETVRSTTAEVRLAIWQRLEEEERKNRIHIVWAAEAGGRAWGMNANDSDFDVRFIYVHEPHWYLSLTPGRDVLEMGVEKLAGGAVLDVKGWELRKALNLAHSNGTVLEWLHSPIVYRSNDEASTALRQLVTSSYSRRSIAQHYVHSAQKLLENDILGKEEFSLKILLFALRPMFCAKWMKEHPLGITPQNMTILIRTLPMTDQERVAMLNLLELRRGGELRAVAEGDAQIAVQWARETIAELKEWAPTAPHQDFPIEDADRLFRSIINGCWPLIRSTVYENAKQR